MPNDLLTYFEKRFATEKMPAKKEPGPFITISRETGCNGTAIARDLAKALSAYGKTWHFVNKEVLEESARTLNLDESKINYVFDSKAKTHIDEILGALSNRYYKNDKMVRKAISMVLCHFAQEGNMIIVGRAGVAVTRDMARGLHLRFVAPYDWRVNSLNRRKAFENINTGLFIKEHDLKKKKLIEQFYGKKFDEIYFDLTLNTEAFSRNQIISIVIEAMKLRSLI